MRAPLCDQPIVSGSDEDADDMCQFGTIIVVDVAADGVVRHRAAVLQVD